MLFYISPNDEITVTANNFGVNPTKYCEGGGIVMINMNADSSEAVASLFITANLFDKCIHHPTLSKTSIRGIEDNKASGSSNQ